jgi:hypothetical protein
MLLLRLRLPHLLLLLAGEGHQGAQHAVHSPLPAAKADTIRS